LRYKVTKIIFKRIDGNLVSNGEDFLQLELTFELYLLEAFEAVALGRSRREVRVGRAVILLVGLLSRSFAVTSASVAEASLGAALFLGLAAEALLDEGAEVDAQVYPLVALDERVGNPGVHLVGHDLLGSIAKHYAPPSL
jgi:hypothetical protein